MELVASEQLALRKHRVPAERQTGLHSKICCERAYKLLCEEHSLKVIAYVFRNSTVIGILLLHQRKG